MSRRFVRDERPLWSRGTVYDAMLRSALRDVRSILTRREQRNARNYFLARQARRRLRGDDWEPMFVSWMH